LDKGDIMANEKFLIIGLGRFGQSVLETFLQTNVEVMVFDFDEQKINKIKDKVHTALILDATNEEVYDKFDLHDFEAAIVTIGEDFETTLLISVLLKQKGVKKVIARASNIIEQKILKRVGADVVVVPEIEIGEKVYKSGNTTGISKEAWDTIKKNKVFLKAPITTPQGGGYKSLNVSTRKFLSLFANVRPCRSYSPYVKTKHPEMDVVIIRENEEDTYGGIEHRQTDEVVQCLKLISRPGCEKIVRYAFEYAKQNKRKKVTCFTKDNIMKQTDGLFHQVFNEIAEEYNSVIRGWINYYGRYGIGELKRTLT